MARWQPRAPISAAVSGVVRPNGRLESAPPNPSNRVIAMSSLPPRSSPRASARGMPLHAALDQPAPRARRGELPGVEGDDRLGRGRVHVPAELASVVAL